jgi:TRAP-type C4-dicarboxylate transport system substrate-binding protein
VPRAARAARRIVQIGFDEPNSSVSSETCRALAEAVAAHPVLAGVLQIELYSDTTVRDAATLTNLCRDGTLDMALVPASALATRFPAFNLLDAPYLFATPAQAQSTLDGAAGREFAALAELDRVVILAWGEIGFEHITAQRPIRSPADLAGLKLAVPASKVVVASVAGFGATPVPTAEIEMFVALHRGELDGAERSVAEAEMLGLPKAQRAISLTAHRYKASVFQACADLADQLSSKQLQALTECAAKAAAVARRLVNVEEAQGILRLTRVGMQVVTDIDRAAFLSRARPIQTALGQSYGAQRLTRLMQG